MACVSVAQGLKFKVCSFCIRNKTTCFCASMSDMHHPCREHMILFMNSVLNEKKESTWNTERSGAHVDLQGNSTDAEKSFKKKDRHQCTI